MYYPLEADKKIRVSLKYVDDSGNRATVHSTSIQWTSSDEEIATVGVLQGDATQAEIVPGAKLGQAQITATASADLGKGAEEIVSTIDVIVLAAPPPPPIVAIEVEGAPVPIDEGNVVDTQPKIDNALPESAATS